MLCQVCFLTEASMHVLDRPPDDPLVETHYCPACYERKYIRLPTGSIVVADDPPSAPPPAFPRLRFAIKDLMLLAGSYAIINAALALFMRSGLVRGTPAQIQAWTIRAFLVANPFFAFFWVEIAILQCLRRLHVHKLTGGQCRFHSKSFSQLIASRMAWEAASPLGRAALVLCLAWPFTWLLWMGLLIPRRAVYFIITRNDPLLTAAVFVLVIWGIWMLLYWGLVASTRQS
jgi:hypothetical protein